MIKPVVKTILTFLSLVVLSLSVPSLLDRDFALIISSPDGYLKTKDGITKVVYPVNTQFKLLEKGKIGKIKELDNKELAEAFRGEVKILDYGNEVVVVAAIDEKPGIIIGRTSKELYKTLLNLTGAKYEILTPTFKNLESLKTQLQLNIAKTYHVVFILLVVFLSLMFTVIIAFIFEFWSFDLCSPLENSKKILKAEVNHKLATTKKLLKTVCTYLVIVLVALSVSLPLLFIFGGFSIQNSIEVLLGRYQYTKPGLTFAVELADKIVKIEKGNIHSFRQLDEKDVAEILAEKDTKVFKVNDNVVALVNSNDSTDAVVFPLSVYQNLKQLGVAQQKQLLEPTRQELVKSAKQIISGKSRYLQKWTMIFVMAIFIALMLNYMIIREREDAVPDCQYQQNGVVTEK